MPVIQVYDKQHTLKPGQTRLGAGPGVDVAVSQDANLGVQAVLELDAENRVVIRKGRDGATVRVNGITLVDPTPLMHGDKVDVAGNEVLFSDDKKVGATQFVSSSDVAAIAAKRSGPARATAATGGRLVSLVDGKEYQVPAAGITFGREAGSDIVVAQAEVSRRHAVIAPAESGYVLTDHSTNGVWVNGNRVEGSQLLSRADVVRVGSEEFRFYADVAPIAKPTPVATPAAPPTPMPEPVAPASPPVRTEPAPPSAAQSPTPAVASQAVPAPRAEPATVPKPMSRAEPPTTPTPAARAEPPTPPTPAPRAEPLTAPSPAKPAAAPKPVRPKPGAAAAVVDKRGGIPSAVWIVLIVAVAAAAYYLGQMGRG